MKERPATDEPTAGPASEDHLDDEALAALVEGAEDGAGGGSAAHRHVAACARCRRELDTLRRAVAALAQTGGQGVPPRFPAQVAERIRIRSRGRFFGAARPLERAPWGIVLAVLLLGLLALYVLVSRAPTGRVDELFGLRRLFPIEHGDGHAVERLVAGLGHYPVHHPEPRVLLNPLGDLLPQVLAILGHGGGEDLDAVEGLAAGILGWCVRPGHSPERYTASMAMAIPWPPPMHAAPIARLALRRRSS